MLQNDGVIEELIQRYPRMHGAAERALQRPIGLPQPLRTPEAEGVQAEEQLGGALTAEDVIVLEADWAGEVVGNEVFWGVGRHFVVVVF